MKLTLIFHSTQPILRHSLIHLDPHTLRKVDFEEGEGKEAVEVAVVGHAVVGHVVGHVVVVAFHAVVVEEGVEVEEEGVALLMPLGIRKRARYSTNNRSSNRCVGDGLGVLVASSCQVLNNWVLKSGIGGGDG